MRLTAVCDVPPPAGIAPNKAPPALRDAGRQQLAVGRSDGLAARGERAAAAIVSVKLIRAMPSAPGHSCRHERRSGRTATRQAARNRPTVSTPCALQAEQADGRDADRDGDERRRQRGEPVLDAQRAAAIVSDAERERRPATASRQRAARCATRLCRNAALGKVDAEQLREPDRRRSPGRCRP